ncbi:MAG: peptidyl-prolyl cis-trans isomerase [Synergistaceae bacterium]|jgi:hypothetical protein|nr:peptidyl-prolyl cis-trans isomerase [Synergistaceae bacterium]
MKRAGIAAVAASLFFFSFIWGSSALAANLDERNIAAVDGEHITERDVIFTISVSAGDDGDGLRTGMALLQMDERARIDLIDRLTDELVLSIEAKSRGLDKDPAAASMLRWQEIQSLAGLYLADASKGWDTSEGAARKYFDDHPEEFVQAEAVKMKYIEIDTGSDAIALASGAVSGDGLLAIAERGKLPLDSPGLTESEWIERGFSSGKFDDAFFSNDAIGIIPPIESDNKIYLIEITSRRPPRQLSWNEAAPEAAERLRRHLLKQEITRSRDKHAISIDIAALNGLGGIETTRE